jgi:hypothetical protein
MRLRCRAHNQYTAECEFGTEFMSAKRQEARRAAVAKSRHVAAAAAKARQVAAEERAHKCAAEARREHGRAAEQANENDVVPWLRRLGFRADEARRAAEFCETAPDGTLEDRVRLALSYLRPNAKHMAAPAP